MNLHLASEDSIILLSPTDTAGQMHKLLGL